MATSIQIIPKCHHFSNKEESEIDRLSDLPDSLLTYILAFLPTKASVATSVLSKRWEYLWTLVPALDFRFYGDPEIDFPPFKDFVYKVLVLSKPLKILKFSLRFIPKSLTLPQKDEYHLKTWIRAAVGCGVQEFVLSVFGPDVKVPSCLFACNSLVSLKLYNCLIDVPASVHFPRLRILHLIDIAIFPTHDSLTKLFSGCPVLEELNLNAYLDSYSFVLSINVPSLKRITLETFKLGADIIEYKLAINAPLLEKLDLSGRAPSFLIQDISNLVEAAIKVYFCRGEPNHKQQMQMCELLQKLANVRFLSLSASVLSAAYAYRPEFSVFQNLIHLELQFQCFIWNEVFAVFAVLESSNNLTSLVLHSANYPHLSENIRCPDKVPKCISMCLKTFDLRGFKGAKFDMCLARYILMKAAFLKRMKIELCYNLKGQSHLLAELLMLPRASKMCEVSFYMVQSR